jgi:hypothetical protein
MAEAIDRREAIRRAALILGGAVSASSIAGVLAGCGRGEVSSLSWKPRALSDEQAELVASIAEHILPQTDTPGARAAGVDRFIDAMVADYHRPEERERFLAGLADVNACATRAHGRAFLRLDAARQRDVLEVLDREAFSPGNGQAAAQYPFMRTMKELAVLGYYTSEIGATKELRYVRVPGRFDGCVPMTATDRTWAI